MFPRKPCPKAKFQVLFLGPHITLQKNVRSCLATCISRSLSVYPLIVSLQLLHRLITPSTLSPINFPSRELASESVIPQALVPEPGNLDIELVPAPEFVRAPNSSDRGIFKTAAKQRGRDVAFGFCRVFGGPN